MGYIDSEQLAFEWVKKNKDSQAKLFGGENSSVSDIYSPKLGWIEVKDLTHGAHCGQFTETTKDNNPYSETLMQNAVDKTDCEKWVRYHYAQKDVNYFITVVDGVINFYTTDEFIINHSFERVIRAKKSGSRHCAKSARSAILALNSKFVLEDNDLWCRDENRFGEYFVCDGKTYVISKHPRCLGRINQCGTTKNCTWLITVK